jgi:hypothetical protein
VNQQQKATTPGGSAVLPLSIWCVVAAFGTYFCMYAFRKSFAAGGFEGITLAGVPYKVVLVTAQVLGYTLSKFIGIRVIAEMQPARRAAMILALIAIAEVASAGAFRARWTRWSRAMRWPGADPTPT